MTLLSWPRSNVDFSFLSLDGGLPCIYFHGQRLHLLCPLVGFAFLQVSGHLHTPTYQNRFPISAFCLYLGKEFLMLFLFPGTTVVLSNITPSLFMPLMYPHKPAIKSLSWVITLHLCLYSYFQENANQHLRQQQHRLSIENIAKCINCEIIHCFKRSPIFFQGSVNFKFGVLFAKDGQLTDDEMFSNGKSRYILTFW